MKVPYYGFKKNNEKTYENNDYLWVDLSIFLKVLTDEVLDKFWNINALEDKDWVEKFEKIAKSMEMSPVALGDNFVDFSEFMISAKLLYMTGWACKYGLWKHGTWSHHGIDLILPKGTPIESFSKGTVYKVLLNHKDWGNCVIVKSDDLFFCYAHLDTVKVKEEDIVKFDQVIWTCWSTWNSTTYHLHFQIDTSKAEFHPYWSKSDNMEEIELYCIDDWDWLRNNYLKTKNSKQVMSKSDKVSTKKDTTKKETDDLVSEMVNTLSKATQKKNIKEDKSDIKLTVAKNHEKKSSKSEEDDLLNDLLSNLSKYTSSKPNYLEFFIKNWILKGDKDGLHLDKPLTRYQFALILYRLKEKRLINLSDKTCKYYFIDTNDISDAEFKKALNFVVSFLVETLSDLDITCFEFLVFK